jgi:single-strand DNA-binding protein
MGRLTKDIELKTTQSGISVTSFDVAVNRKRADKDGNRQTDYFTCVAWRSSAEFLSKWFRKGDMIAVEGEMQTRKYTDKNGNNRTAYEILVDNAYFCGGKKNEQNNQQNVTQFTPPAQPPEFEEITDEDLPF